MDTTVEARNSHRDGIPQFGKGSAMDVSFATHILPKFRPGDVSCMARAQVKLNDAAWMCDPSGAAGYPDHANARRVFSALSKGIMPPDAPWSPDWVATYQQWMDSGFHP
jgi:hypothetical protein